MKEVQKLCILAVIITLTTNITILTNTSILITIARIIFPTNFWPRILGFAHGIFPPKTWARKTGLLLRDSVLVTIWGKHYCALCIPSMVT